MDVATKDYTFLWYFLKHIEKLNIMRKMKDQLQVSYMVKI